MNHQLNPQEYHIQCEPGMSLRTIRGKVANLVVLTGMVNLSEAERIAVLNAAHNATLTSQGKVVVQS